MKTLYKKNVSKHSNTNKHEEWKSRACSAYCSVPYVPRAQLGKEAGGIGLAEDLCYVPGMISLVTIHLLLHKLKGISANVHSSREDRKIHC